MHRHAVVSDGAGLSTAHDAASVRRVSIDAEPRRLVTVRATRALGAYRILSVFDAQGTTPTAGQFAMLATAGPSGGREDDANQPRPFAFMRWQGGCAHFLVHAVGRATRRLCELQAGERLWVQGPLGSGFVTSGERRRAILVGGGVGIAPLVILRETLMRDRSAAVPVTLLGFRDRRYAESASLIEGARVATDDGSAGHHGYVIEMLMDELRDGLPAVVYACGPAVMLEAVRALCRRRRVSAQLALESATPCTSGACMRCVVPMRGGGHLRVCVDGPVVSADRLLSVGGPAVS